MRVTPGGVDEGKGPSWYDVFIILKELEALTGHRPKVHFAACRSVDNRWMLAIVVRESDDPKSCYRGDHYQPGGARSAKTVCAAVYLAATKLYHTLEPRYVSNQEQAERT